MMYGVSVPMYDDINEINDTTRKLEYDTGDEGREGALRQVFLTRRLS